MALVNMAEPIVKERLTELLEKSDCCKCDICFTDMMAIALNQVKPKYVNTHQGELLQRVNAHILQNSIDMDIAIMKAIELVRQAPHHNR